MAIVSNNDLTLGLRGRLGKNLVFRSVGGKTVVSWVRSKPQPQKQSAAQRQTRATFKEAAAWAVHILQNPQQKQYYQARAQKLSLPNAYTAALQEFMRGQVVPRQKKTRTPQAVPNERWSAVEEMEQKDRQPISILNLTQRIFPQGMAAYPRSILPLRDDNDTHREKRRPYQSARTG